MSDHKPQPHRATPFHWSEMLRTYFNAAPACILELRARVEALEAAQQHVTVKESLTAQPAPAGSLLEVVDEAIHDEAGSRNATVEARAAIRAVADWLRRCDSRVAASVQIAGVLEQEAAK